MRVPVKLPRLLLIADRFTRPDVSLRVLEAVHAGVAWVQLRDHDASTDVFDFRSEKLIQDMKQINQFVLVSVNSRLSIASVQDLPLHTGRHGPSVAEARTELGSDAVIGCSIHSRLETEEARREGASYVTFSPVWETRTHPEHRGQGADVLGEVCKAAGEMPVLAMGGVVPHRVETCFGAGAWGVAVHQGILGADSIPSAVHAYRTAIVKAQA